MRKFRFAPNFRRGLSLVEVTLALGIAAFGLVILVGLIPTGLQQVRESSTESVAVNILSQLVAHIRNSAAGGSNEVITLTPGQTGKTLFDEQGRMLPENTPASQAIYAASWEVRGSDSAGGIPGNVYLVVTWPAAATNPTGLVETVVPWEEDN